jgi:hypothetical protein
MVIPALEAKKTYDVMEVIVELVAMATLESSVLPDSSTPTDAGAGRTEAGTEATIKEEPEVRGASPEILAGEPIVTPPLASTILLVAHLLTSSKVIGNPHQRTAPEDQGAVGPSSEDILVTPPKWQYVISTDLIEDPMQSSVTLTEF